MEDNIKNIYLMNFNPNKKKFFFSVADPNNPLKYDYYVLNIEKGIKPYLFKAFNILQTLEDTQTKIIKIDKNDELYDLFRISLQSAKKYNFSRHVQKYPRTNKSYRLKKDND